MIADNMLYLNGIDAVTGQYLVPPMNYDQAGALIRRERTDKEKENESRLQRLWRVISETHLGPPLGVRLELVEESGWAVVFHQHEDAAVKAALQLLIEHRMRLINNDQAVKELEYRDGEDSASWLARYGVAAGSIRPDKVPYYLMFVGSPERIPFTLLHNLDVEYAIGLLHFDTLQDYSNYAQSVIDYETSQNVPNSKQAVFFGTRHPFDKATQMSADLLVNPLAEGGDAASFTHGVAARWGFGSRKVWGDAATRNALEAVFHPSAGQPPAVVFSATHGMGWPTGHADQLSSQGALLCQDWPGFGQISSDHYFAAKDLSDDARVHGMIPFLFACYGGGTPQRDRFIHSPGSAPPEIAAKPFVASLAKRLLAHPKGGALACIGHVERAWGYSIVTPGAGAQLQPFENTLGALMIGWPVGHAVKDFNERYAALSTSLASLLEQAGFGAAVSNFDLASSWIARNDAEGYLVIGDPAVKLRVNDLKQPS
jgi:hypothetical protein